MMKDQILKTASVEIEVPFFDIDVMDIVWHGHYVKYFEITRCELLKQIDYDYQTMRESGYIWPVVDMRLKYIASATFGQKITVTANLVEYESRIKINYLITDSQTGKKLTKGYTVQVALDAKTNEMQYQSPAILLEKLGIDVRSAVTAEAGSDNG